MTGLYIHIPFCEKKCSYCDFYSIESTRQRGQFVDALLREITKRSELFKRRSPITSVFFGGGTPSLLTATELRTIANVVTASFDIAPDAEWTMECNPGTVTLESLCSYRESGINRLSFGVQSFIESELHFLDRIHSVDDAVNAMDLARQSGFSNVNMDLMFAVPGQTLSTLEYSLQRLIDLSPDHISAYSLIYEQGTPLYTQMKKGSVTPTEEETDADMYSMVMDTLSSNGYSQYEVSNFAKPGRQCRHNLTYWHAEDYLAVGPSAHGRIGHIRTWNIRSLNGWLTRLEANELPDSNNEYLTPQEQLEELAFLTLRADGLPVKQFQDEHGIDIYSTLKPDIDYWLEEGLVISAEGRIRLTSKGYGVCDEITLKVMAKLESVASHIV